MTSSATLIDSKQTPTLPAGVATVAVTTAFTALGVFAGPGAHDIGEFLFVVGLSAILTALVFWLCVDRLEERGSAAAVGLTLSVVGLVGVAMFFMGITPPLAVAGLLLGLSARRRDDHAGVGSAAVVVAALALIGYTAVYITDWMATNNIAGM